MIPDEEVADPAPSDPVEKPKLQIQIAVNPKTGSATVQTNQEPIVISVSDFTNLLNQFVQNMRPKEARRIILP